MDFGQKVQLLRKNNGISQERLANELNINRNYLSRIETGKSEPELSVIKNIAVLFNVDISSLMGMDNSILSSDEKIKNISDGCKHLIDSDLDLLIRLITILREEYIKKDI